LLGRFGNSFLAVLLRKERVEASGRSAFAALAAAGFGPCFVTERRCGAGRAGHARFLSGGNVMTSARS
jgi:hypothetical protein